MGLVPIQEAGNIGGSVMEMVRAIEDSQVFTTSLACHPNHLAGHHRAERGVQGNYERQIETFKHTPANIGDCQPGTDQIPEEDFNEEAVEPVLEPEDILA